MSLPVFGLTAAFLVVMAVPLAVPLHLPGNLLLLNGAVDASAGRRLDAGSTAGSSATTCSAAS